MRKTVLMQTRRSSRHALNVIALLSVIAPLGGPARAAGATIAIADESAFAARAGEAQSTVIAPHLKAECPAGRVLMSNDLKVRDLVVPKGAVLGRDLDHLDGPTIEAAFDRPSNFDTVKSGQDHDLIALKNGDVLLIDMVSSDEPVIPKPSWFDETFRDDPHGDFGPGARTGLRVWRSTDCGVTFHVASVFDPATVGDRTCAYPQHPAPTAHHPLDMGGSDGPNTFYSPQNDRVFSVFQCVGSKPDPATPDKFVLSNDRLNVTALMESSDEGTSWHFLGLFPKAEWRRSVVAPHPNKLALAVGTGLVFGVRDINGGFTFNDPAALVPNLGRSGLKTEGAKEFGATYGNIWGHPILTLLPGHRNKFVLAVPTKLRREQAGPEQLGYRVFLYDGQTQRYAEIEPVFPPAGDKDDYLMHLGVINLGQGPLLMFWSEFDIQTQQGQFKGRLVFNEAEYSSDFVIGRKADAAAPWPLTPKQNYWYGDYQTGWGVVGATSADGRSRTVDYYPIWIESKNQVPFTRVSVTVPANDRSAVGTVQGPAGLTLKTVPAQSFSIAPSIVRLSALPSATDIGEEEEDEDGPQGIDPDDPKKPE